MRISTRKRLVSTLSATIWIAAASLTAQHKVTFELTGTFSGDGCGYSVAFAGDLNGDGVGDLFVGYRAIRRVRGISGRDGQILWTAVGPDSFGHTIAALGDISGDGITDAAVGAPDADVAGANSGQVSVISGADGSILQAGIFPFRAPMVWNGGAIGDQFGWALTASDLTGDGCRDVVVGAPRADTASFDVGFVTVFDSKSGSRLFTHYGNVAGERLGHSVAELGDANGDGSPELLAGAPRYDGGPGPEVGRVQILKWSSAGGSQVDATYVGQTAGERFGSTVAGVGDVEIPSFPAIGRDGAPDFLVGSPTFGASNEGRAYLFSGKPVLTITPASFSPSNAGSGFGTRMLAIGDFDIDSVPDYAISATNTDHHGLDSGSVYVYSGSTAQVIALLNGDEPQDRFGWALAAGERYSGGPELFVGVPFSDVPQVGAGMVRGFDPLALDAYIGIRYVTQCSLICPPISFPGGPSLTSTLRDVDRDGHDEIVTAHNTFIGSVSAQTSTYLWSTTGASSWSALATVGDVDGDGLDDLLASSVGGGYARVLCGVTGSQLHDIPATSAFVNFGERVFATGDVDGDGHADFGLTTHPFASPSTTTRIHIYSGRTGNYMWGIVIAAPDTPVAGIDDTDGDGLPEIAVWDGTTLTVWDGRTAIALVSASMPGPVHEIEGVGDVNGDGIGDLAVLSDLEVWVLSGANLGRIWGSRGRAFGKGDRIRRAGDHNGDGRPDVLVGSPKLNFVRIQSGIDGTDLLVLTERWAFHTGIDLSAGDVSGDGRPDVVLGHRMLDPYTNWLRSIIAVPTELSGTPPRTPHRGISCSGTGGIPRLDARPRPSLGTTVDVWLRAAPPSTAATLLLGSPTLLDLTGLGAPGCLLFVDLSTAAQLVTTTSGQGTTSQPIPIPVTSALVGASVTAQWAIVDPPANSLGITSSEARDLVIGELR